MRKFRILVFEVVGLALFIGWLLWKYPESVDGIIPWVALLIAWHLTWEYILDTDVFRRWGIAFRKRIKPMIAWPLVFLLGGCVSLSYWKGIDKSLKRLSSIAEARVAAKALRQTDGTARIAPQLPEKHETTDSTKASPQRPGTEDTVHAASGEKPRLRPGKIKILNNEGTIDGAKIRDNKIMGSPPPNTETTILNNSSGGRIKDLLMEGNEIAAPPQDIYIPPPIGTSDLQGSYKARLKQLIRDTEQWTDQTERGEPKLSEPKPEMIEQYREYWRLQMKQFHETTGKQILFIMSHLRNCDYRVVKEIYWIEESGSLISASIGELLEKMKSLEQMLPDDDKQIPCAK